MMNPCPRSVRIPRIPTFGWVQFGIQRRNSRGNVVRRLFCLAVFGTVLASTGCSASGVRDTDIKYAKLDQVRAVVNPMTERERSQNVLLVDPRTRDEYEAGHLPKARNLRTTHALPDRDVDPVFNGYNTILVYGTNPGDAVARAMVKRLIAGKKTAVLFAGGIEEWTKHGGPLETGPDPLADTIDDTSTRLLPN